MIPIARMTAIPSLKSESLAGVRISYLLPHICLAVIWWIYHRHIDLLSARHLRYQSQPVQQVLTNIHVEKGVEDRGFYAADAQRCEKGRHMWFEAYLHPHRARSRGVKVRGGHKKSNEVVADEIFIFLIFLFFFIFFLLRIIFWSLRKLPFCTAIWLMSIRRLKICPTGCLDEAWALAIRAWQSYSQAHQVTLQPRERTTFRAPQGLPDCYKPGVDACLG